MISRGLFTLKIVNKQLQHELLWQQVVETVIVQRPLALNSCFSIRSISMDHPFPLTQNHSVTQSVSESLTHYRFPH